MSWVYSLVWTLRHIECPGPKVLISEVVADGAKCPQSIVDLWVPGGPYGIGIDFGEAFTRKLKPEALASVRHKRLEARVQKNYPLFADQFIGEALASKPEHYAGAAA